MLGVLTGLRQEARIIARRLPGVPLALSHATAEGAQAGMDRLRAEGVTEVLSFGCAGGLTPNVEPGSIIVADYVHWEGHNYRVDELLSERFGAVRALRGGVLHSAVMIEKATEKHCLYQDTGFVAVDMESGVVARSGLPFAVLRVVCDDAARDLPPAASESLREGRVHVPALMRSLIRHPGQIPSLVTMGRDAARARAAMEAFLQKVSA